MVNIAHYYYATVNIAALLITVQMLNNSLTAS